MSKHWLAAGSDWPQPTNNLSDCFVECLTALLALRAFCDVIGI